MLGTFSASGINIMEITTVKFFIILLCVGLIAGCSGENLSDLHQYVKDVKAKQKSRIEPLPEIVEYPTYAYTESELRDPFIPPAPKRIASSNPNLRPDHHTPDVLEQFPLDTLQMVGSLEQSGQRWALIKAQDGTLYRTTRGRYMGQDNGKIINITESQVVLQEIVPDGLGGWVKREAVISVSE
jgi:type IV pilus assembly protein PilP